MKILIMTDMEGSAGLLNFKDWISPAGRYYEKGKSFLTNEVNAAIDGFFEGGATEIIVVDGHGHGGIDPELLDERAVLRRGMRREVVGRRGRVADTWSCNRGSKKGIEA